LKNKNCQHDKTVTHEMRYRGIKITVSVCAKCGEEIGRRIAEEERRLYGIL
jgi:hypothetical protein